MNTSILSYYKAIERASGEMLEAARDGDWEQVVKIEGACVLLIAQLRHASRGAVFSDQDARLKVGIMQRILVNDAEIRELAEPCIEDLERAMPASPSMRLH